MVWTKRRGNGCKARLTIRSCASGLSKAPLSELTNNQKSTSDVASKRRAHPSQQAQTFGIFELAAGALLTSCSLDFGPKRRRKATGSHGSILFHLTSAGRWTTQGSYLSIEENETPSCTANE